jgi:hypothetical protein
VQVTTPRASEQVPYAPHSVALHCAHCGPLHEQAMRPVESSQVDPAAQLAALQRSGNVHVVPASSVVPTKPPLHARHVGPS